MAKYSTAYAEEVREAFKQTSDLDKEVRALIHKFSDNEDQLTEEELALFNAFKNEYYDKYMNQNYTSSIWEIRRDYKLIEGNFESDMGTAEEVEQHEWDDAWEAWAIHDRKYFIVECAEFVQAVEKLRGDFLEKYEALQASKAAIAIKAPAQPKTQAKVVKQQSVSIFSRIKNTIVTVCRTVKRVVVNTVNTLKDKIVTTIAAVKTQITALAA